MKLLPRKRPAKQPAQIDWTKADGFFTQKQLAALKRLAPKRKPKDNRKK